MATRLAVPARCDDWHKWNRYTHELSRLIFCIYESASVSPILSIRTMSTKHDLFVQDRSRITTETRRMATEFNCFYREARSRNHPSIGGLSLMLCKHSCSIKLIESCQCAISMRASYGTTMEYFLSMVCAIDLCSNNEFAQWIILENTFNNSGWKGERFLILRVHL